MNTETRKAFLADLAEYTRKGAYVEDLVEVVDFEEDIEYGGYCETCAYEGVVVRVTYLDSAGKRQTATIYESFGSLMRSLLNG